MKTFKKKSKLETENAQLENLCVNFDDKYWVQKDVEIIVKAEAKDEPDQKYKGKLIVSRIPAK